MGGLGLGLRGVHGLGIVVCVHSFPILIDVTVEERGGREDLVLSCLKKGY